MSGASLDPLVALGRWLMSTGYHFITATPETHRRVNARAAPQATDLRDVFGWSRPFDRRIIPGEVMDWLSTANALRESPQGWRSTVRFSTLGARLFVHSGFPTVEADAVFFGPDTYRFCRAMDQARLTGRLVVDVGCGTGVGGLLVAPAAGKVVLADINPQALAFARVNVQLAERAPHPPAPTCEVAVTQSDLLAQVEGAPDLIIANPPYMKDAEGRTYRDGGGARGEGLSLRLVREAKDRLAPRGTLFLYTGVAIASGGVDPFFEAVRQLLDGQPFQVRYEEVDPDVFGDELEHEAYHGVERIAAVALTVQRL